MTKSREIPYAVFVAELHVGFVLRNADGTRPKITKITEERDILGQLFRTITLDNGEVEVVPNDTLITIVSDN